MIRALFWLLVLILGVAALRNKFANKGNSPKVGDALRRSQIDSSEPMHRCAHCGVYVPASESFAEGDAHYCSEPHRRLHKH